MVREGSSERVSGGRFCVEKVNNSVIEIVRAPKCRYSFTSAGLLASEDGPLDNDTVTYAYMFGVNGIGKLGCETINTIDRPRNDPENGPKELYRA